MSFSQYNYTTINRSGVIDKVYIAVYVDQLIHLFAASKAQARQRAIEHFRLKKKQLIDLTVITLDEYLKR